MTNIVLKEQVNELKMLLGEKVQKHHSDELKKWLGHLDYVLAHVDEVAYGRPLVENLLCYVRMETDQLQKIDDAVVLNTQNTLVMDLVGLLKRRGECAISAFLKADPNKVIRPGSPHLFRGHRCQLRQNNHSKTLSMTVDDLAEDKEEVIGKILGMI